MKFSKIFSAVIVFAMIALTSSAQIKLVGKTIQGNERVGNDPTGVVTFELLGLGTDPYRYGTTLSFGDFGTPANGSANVFVSEAWGWDSDQLQLHGKNGINFTTDGNGNKLVGGFSSIGDFYVYGGDIYSRGVQITSDVRLKSNLKSINSALASVVKLQGLTYDFSSKREDSLLVVLESTKFEKDKDIKEVANKKRELEQKKADNLNQIGFSAQEVQKLFPQLVKSNTEGYLTVNYTGLIPVLVESIKEQQAIIDAQKVTIDALQKDIAAIKAKLGMK